MKEFDVSKLDRLGQAMLELGVLAYGLTADRAWVANQVDVDDEDGSARRAYVRVMLSFIEGMSNGFKNVLIAANQIGRLKLSSQEKDALVNLQFDPELKPMTQPRRRLRLKDRIHFILMVLGRHSDSPFKPNFGDEGWRAFLSAIVIRNRVTHPHSREDLWITEADLDIVDRAVKWFEDETARFHLSKNK